MSLARNIAHAIGNPRSVHCTVCHRDQPVDAASCLEGGWPKCCGYTMTMDSHATRCKNRDDKSLKGALEAIERDYPASDKQEGERRA
jgi:hypothetical protein